MCITLVCPCVFMRVFLSAFVCMFLSGPVRGFVRVPVRVCASMSVRVHACASVRVCASVHVSVCTGVSVHLCASVYVPICAGVPVCLYASIYVPVCASLLIRVSVTHVHFRKPIGIESIGTTPSRMRRFRLHPPCRRIAFCIQEPPIQAPKLSQGIPKYKFLVSVPACPDSKSGPQVRVPQKRNGGLLQGGRIIWRYKQPTLFVSYYLSISPHVSGHYG